ncbi:MAG: hydroxyacid dehydrogenase, partial [Deltaproteobacteria bacterium]|nr:hydroxyacid dehydrogenase [Deltaproteobacteria bacterium]
DLLHEAGVKVLPNPYGRRLTESEIISHLHGVDGLIAGLEPLNHNVLHSSPKLKALARVGIGMDNVDLKAAEELGVKVSNTPDGPTQAVAEMTLAAMLLLCRNVIQANTDLHEKVWKKSIGTGLQGAKVLLVGYGRIGRAVGRVVASLGAEILVTDPLIAKGELVNGEKLIDFYDALQVADVISLHAGGREVLLGVEEFNKMKDGVIILNGARGELIDEDALIENLDNGRVNGAWMDVFREEPY